MSHQFKGKGAKGKVYIILVVDFAKWTNILGHPEIEKVDKQIGMEGVLTKIALWRNIY